MKRFMILAASVVVTIGSVVGCSRSMYGADDEGRAMNRAIQKRTGEIQDSLNYAEALRAIEDRNFVFEANMLVFKRGGTARVFSNLNFVSLKGDNATIQVAPYDVGGPNGLGGVTVDGRVTHMEVKSDKRGNTRVTMNVMGRAVFATVEVTLTRGSNNAMITVAPNMNSNRVTLYGVILPTDKSRIFKGIAL